MLDILRCLPKTNCGLCTHPTCMAFAAMVFRREVPISVCEPFMVEIEKHGELLNELRTNGYEIPRVP